VLALKPSPALEAVEVVGQSAFMAMEEEWNALVVSTRDEPFYRHEFLRIWMDNFAASEKLEVLTARDGAGKLTAAFPLIRSRRFVCGLPARSLQSTANSHSCRFDMVARDGPAAGRAFFSHLTTDKTWDMIRISDVPEGGNAWHLYRAAEDAGFPVGAWESQRSPYLPIPSSHRESPEPSHSSLNATLRRRRRRLEAMGTVSVERVTGGAQLRERLEEGFALERSGWKGKEGTAILQDKSTHGFYTELARTAAARDYLSLFFLRLNGKPIAFHYGLTYGGVYYMPKLGYDESVKKCSPGLVLVDEVVKDCLARGVKGYDFLGPEVEWKMKWSSQVRPHHWLYIFRDSSFGQALQKAKFTLIPTAKHVLWPWRQDKGIDG